MQGASCKGVACQGGACKEGQCKEGAGAGAGADLCIVAPVLADLRAKVVGGPHPCLGQLHGAAQHLGHPKVPKLEQPPRRHEHIL